jgi:endoglucanase
MKLHIKPLFSLFLLLTLLSFLVVFNCSNSDDVTVTQIANEAPEETDPETPEQEAPVEVGVIRDITASALVADMGPGWNFGNSFDVRSRDKTLWGNPLPTTRTVDAVFDRGFRTLRLPITWGYNMGDGPSFTIESSYFDRVEAIVSHALEKGMYVIINVHHDDEWIIPTRANASATNAQLSRVWSQIATRFRNYSDFLIFEVLNEPRHVGTPEEWTGGTAEGRSVLNTFHKTALDAIRATGGNNTERKIMIPPYAALISETVWNALVIPNNDPNVIISLHAYFPLEFALLATDPDWGSTEDRRQVTDLMNRITSNFINRGFPVVMGEWGAIDTIASAEARETHAEFFVQACLSKGIVPIVWDDGGDFGLLSRPISVWEFPNIADAAANR